MYRIGFLVSAMLFSFLMVSCKSKSSSTSQPFKDTRAQEANIQDIKIKELIDLKFGQQVLLKDIPENVYLMKSITRTTTYPNSSNGFQHVFSGPGWPEENDEVSYVNYMGTKQHNFQVGFPLEIHFSKTNIKFIDLRTYREWSDESTDQGWELDKRNESHFCDNLGEVFDIAKTNELSIYEAKSASCAALYKMVFQLLEDRLYITVHQVQDDEFFGESFTRYEYIKGEQIDDEPVSKTYVK